MRRAKGRRESVLESRCVRYARARGVVVAKLQQCDGIPDRIFFVPGGRPLIIEFKAEKKVPEKLQNWYLSELKKQKYRVAFCEDWESFLNVWNTYVKC